jgi:hypothetical protein
MVPDALGTIADSELGESSNARRVARVVSDVVRV